MDSHYHKRYYALKEHGYDVVAYGFKRNVNISKFLPEDIELLPVVENGNYLKRIRTVYSVVCDIISKHGKNVLYYATTFDIALVCYLKKVKYVYGISDLVHSNFTKPLRKPFIYLDKKIIDRSYCTVLTSEGFIPYLGLNSHILKKCIFVKNKLDKKFLSVQRPANIVKTANRLRFGFAGYIRYETTLRFAEVIGKNFPEHSFVFWGNGCDEIMHRVQEICISYNNVTYNGTFNNPTDLVMVYESIDIMACNYDTHTINERLAEPNKLYECIFFNKPLITTKDTFFGETVKRLNIGTSTDNSEKDINNLIAEISLDLVSEWKKQEGAICTEDLMEDFSQLFTFIDSHNSNLLK